MSPSRFLPVLLLSLSAACAEAPTAPPISPAADPSLIVFGEPDGARHPYVGLLVFFDEEGGWSCSGTLLSPTVVLTAAHCTFGAEEAYAWFDEAPLDDPDFWASAHAGTAHTYEEVCSRCTTPAVSGWLQGDVGIVVLEEPVPSSEVNVYGQLPEEGYVETLTHMTTVGLVGYGVRRQVVGNGPPDWTDAYQRFYAEADLIAGDFVNQENVIRLSANPAQGKGGTCYGDSGGPNLIGDIVIGVTSYGPEPNCRSVWYSSRVDTPEILSWIEGFLDP